MSGFSARTRTALSSIASLSIALTATVPAGARVVDIVVDDTQPLAPAAGQTIAYEQISGRAFGELDPRDPLNAIIQDIELGKSPDGKVRYVASKCSHASSIVRAPIHKACSSRPTRCRISRSRSTRAKPDS
jgi:hypothetical protein